MIKKKIIISNKLGLHARAAAKFVAIASAFDAEIQLSRAGRAVNGKSIMGVMMLAASKDTEVELEVWGKDEQAAFSKLEDLINKGFGEE